jgi:hypothetical protein
MKKKKKALKSFFRPKTHLVCRFCSTPIADLKDGALIPNDSYARADVVLESGQVYRLNGCDLCIAELDVVGAKEALVADKAIPALMKKLECKEVKPIETEKVGTFIADNYVGRA